jgi:5-methylcytosine-specific restriction endonuclease McrA
VVKDTRTYKDRSEYLKKAVTKRRRELKKRAVEFKGGKCVLCGYNKYIGALEFHHKKDTNKNFGISMQGYSRSWDKIKEEIEKCMLVCSNCHRELHYKN